MARDTLTEAKAELVALLEAARATFDEAQVHDHQPLLSNLNDGKGVCVFTVRYTRESYFLGVRILISGGWSPADAQARLDEWIPAVEAALTSHYGPIDFTTEFATEDDPYYAATVVLEVGREDF